MFRSGVRAELGEAVEVIGEADEVEAAIELINERVPDVVLLDVHLPGGGGQAVLRGVTPHHPEVQFLALSVSDAPEDVIAVIRSGARGYVTKTISGDELLHAVYRVGAGDAVFSPRLAGFVLDAFAGAGAGTPPSLDPELDQLSPREREVLRLIARVTPTKRWPAISPSRPRPSSHTSRRCCASCNSRPPRTGQVGHRPTAGLMGGGPVERQSHTPAVVR